MEIYSLDNIKSDCFKVGTLKNKKSKGITLIALVITIVILLILSGITIATLTGENGLFARSKQAKQSQIESEMKEKLNLSIQTLQVEKLAQAKLEDITQEWLLQKMPEYNPILAENIEDIKKVILKKDAIIKTFLINEKLNIIELENEKESSNEEKDSLINVVKNIHDSGYYNIVVSDEQYNIHLYVLKGNQKWETNQIFGDESDVANEESYASNMVVVKIEGDLEIENNSIVTSYVSPNGYGGPKGMLIYCTGTIVNNGKISMTARGAYAKGQNVYLWKNEDGSYEYIPAIGAEGGIGQDSSQGLKGNDGNTAMSRATGGGRRSRRILC